MVSPAECQTHDRKFSPHCQRSRKFTNLERMSFAFLKTSGSLIAESMHTKQGRGGERNAVKWSLCFAMIRRKEPSELYEWSPQTFSDLVFHIHYLSFRRHMARFLIAYDSD